MASRVLLSLLLAPTLTGCGMAAGRFRYPGGNAPTHGADVTLVHQTCSGGSCATTGTSEVHVIDKMSVALGVEDGYAHSKIKNDAGAEAEQSGLALHVYLDYHYHLAPHFTLAIDGGIDLQNWDDMPLAKLGLDKNNSYIALGGVARTVFTTSIDTIDASNLRLNAGLHHKLTNIDSLNATVLLRLDAYYTVWGQHDFAQQSVLGGFCFWFRAD
jgi:hypothetical protein